MKEKREKMQEKEFFYIGHYYSADGRYILKIGTTDNLDRRQKEHNRNYAKAKENGFAEGQSFIYDWFIPLSKYNTLRIEDRTRDSFIASAFGEYIRNDRFAFAEKPDRIFIEVKKVYEILL